MIAFVPSTWGLEPRSTLRGAWQQVLLISLVFSLFTHFAFRLRLGSLSPKCLVALIARDE